MATSLQRSAAALTKHAGSSSSTKPSDEPIFIDPTDDATFQSLKKLLSAPSTSTQHLSLLSESTLYGSITYYLSKLELEHVAEFAGIISSSGCLWTPPPPSASPPNASSSGSSQQKVTWTTEPGSPANSAIKAAASSSSTSQSAVASAPTASTLSSFLITRSTHISQAVAAALTKRVDLIVRSKNNKTGWAARSALSQFLGAIIQGIDDAERDATPESYRAARGLPVPRFAVIGGLLNSLYILKDQRKRLHDMSILEEMAALRANPVLGLSVRRQLSTVEDEWIVTLAEILDRLHGQRPPANDSEEEVDEWETEFRKRTASVAAGPASITSVASTRVAHDVRDVPLYMAAQLAPFVPDRKIHALDPVQLVSATSEAILQLFEGAGARSFLGSLVNDVHTMTCGEGEEAVKVVVDPNGDTAKVLQGVTGATLFPLLGPLSKLLSRALAKAVTSLTPEELSALLLGTTDAALDTPVGQVEFFPLLVRMSRLSSNLEAAWLASLLAGVEEDQIADESKQLTKQLWTVFKTVLFSYTMVFDSMMDALVDMCPSPTVTVPPSAEQVADTSRKWPAASTSNLPPPYLSVVQHVLGIYSHLYWITSTFGSDGFDVYRKVFYSALDVIGRDGDSCIQLLELIAPPAGEIEANRAKRSTTTYFLNVAEQLVGVLPDAVVEQLVLPICRPYLEDTRFSDTFESAHSVVLALYAAGKRCILNLAPFYVELLLKSFPGKLTAQQFEYAMSTVVGAVSDRSDSVAWWVMERVAEEVENERLSASSTTAQKVQVGFNESSATKQDLDSATAESDSQPLSPSTQEETAQEYDRLTHLQLCFIACIPAINLVLLRSALAKVEGYILQHGEGGERVVLCQKAFEAVQALNSATREEGLRWWLDQRVRFGV